MEITTYTCDRCGYKVQDENGCMFDITPIYISFGYGSKFDLETWSMDLCDDCIETITKDFAKNIKVTENSL